MNFTKYHIVTGRIVSIHTAQSHNNIGSDADHAFLDGIYNADLQYILEGFAQERPVMGIIINNSQVTINEIVTLLGVMIGAHIYVGSALIGIADGSNIELVFDLAGIYSIEIKLFPYLNWKGTINVN